MRSVVSNILFCKLGKKSEKNLIWNIYIYIFFTKIGMGCAFSLYLDELNMCLMFYYFIIAFT